MVRRGGFFRCRQRCHDRGRPAGAASATDTLDALAGQFQRLPIESLAPAIVLLLGGLLLLIAGRYFLRAVMVVTTVLLGAMLGPSILGGVFPTLAGTVLAFIGGLVGLVFVAIAWRLVLGAATGVIAAFACAIAAMLLVDAGFIDARRAGDQPGSGDTAEGFAALTFTDQERQAISRDNALKLLPSLQHK